MSEQRVLIADIVRTPWCKPGGALDKFISSDLAAAAIKQLLRRTGVDPMAVGQVVFGQAHPSTMPNNIGHYSWLKAELPVEVPGYTVQCNTASALQAVRNAYYLIASGNEEICMAGGADSYSAAPFVMRDVRNHFYPQHRMVIDTLDEAECATQPEHLSRQEQYEIAHPGPVTRRDAEFILHSKQKAEQFMGMYLSELVPLSYTDRKKGDIIIDADQLTQMEETALAPYADGAAVTLLMNEEQAERWGIRPQAELLGFAVSGCDPTQSPSAGAAAVRKLLDAKGLQVSDLTCLEVMENSAADVFDTLEALGISESDVKVNPMGGALAYGKNDGADGIAMLLHLTKALNPGELGVVCIYSPGGLGMAALVKGL